LAAQLPPSEALKQIHQTMDAVSILKPVTKFSATVGAPDQLSEVLANAFRAAESGRPGASYVNLPKDVMTEPCAHEPLPAPAFAGLGPADGAAIKEAARLINAASNPVVLLGMLASKPANAEALQTFIGKNNLAVVGTFQAAGAVGAMLFDNFGGRVGQLANQPADRLLESADLVVTVGYDPVEYWPPLWNGKSRRKIIHVDVLPADLDNCYGPYVELTGDIAQTLQALTPQLQRTQKSALSSGILETISAERKLLSKEAAARGGYRFIPCDSSTNCSSSSVVTSWSASTWVVHLWIARHLYSFRPRQVLISNGQQTLGVALPWGIAASIVRPAEKILSISGDGASLFRNGIGDCRAPQGEHRSHGLDRWYLRYGGRSGETEIWPNIGDRLRSNRLRQVCRGIRRDRSHDRQARRHCPGHEEGVRHAGAGDRRCPGRLPRQSRALRDGSRGQHPIMAGPRPAGQRVLRLWPFARIPLDLMDEHRIVFNSAPNRPEKRNALNNRPAEINPGRA